MTSIDNLLEIAKPARYIGKEWNSAKKKLAADDVKFAICYPDVYELGMSNLAVRIIYGILNNLNGIFCDRVFCPWPDFQKYLLNNNKTLCSLETGLPLKDFDVLGFSLGYELTYTNVLTMLKLGGIPLFSKERDLTFPLIVGGGPSAVNPEPMHEFFDIFFIGEAEEFIVEFGEYLKRLKKNAVNKRISKKELLLELAQFEGVYVPLLYDVSFDKDGFLKEFFPLDKNIPKTITKRFVRVLDKAYYPLNWLVPNIATIHDRVSLEIMRGCPHKCRFCQARKIYYPYRLKSMLNLEEIGERILKDTGYEEIGLCGLSVSDHQAALEIIKYFTKIFKENAVSVSLSSLRADSILDKSLSVISEIKKAGITFAPEAGSERLREAIGKDLDIEKLFKLSQDALDLGWRHLKLYFMVGLPTENMQDLDEIIDMVEKITKVTSKSGKRFSNINLSVNPFIPKPHTDFELLALENKDKLIQKREYLKSRLKEKAFSKVNFSFHNIDISFIEAALSRGDRRLSNVIYSAWANGAKFDAWQEHFNIKLWDKAFLDNNMNPEFYANRIITLGETLSWGHINLIS